MAGKIKLYISNLFRKKFQTVLIVTSIAIGICAVTVIGSVGKIGQREIEKEINSVGIGSFLINIETKINPDVLITDNDLEILKNIDGVTATAPIIMEYTQTTMCGLIGTSAAWGINSGEVQFVPLKLRYGRFFTPEDIEYEKMICILDQNMALTYFKRENVVGKTLEITFLDKRYELEIVGVVESGGNVIQSALESYVPAFLYLPYTTMQTLTGKSGYSRVAVEVAPGYNVETVAGKVVQKLSHLSGKMEEIYKTQNINEQKEQLNTIMELVTLILSGVAGISIVVSALGIAVIMMVTVSERTREIGIKKAIGAKNGEIMLEFLFEAFLLSLTGTVFGFVLGSAVVWVCCLVFGTVFSINVKLTLVAALVTIFMGIVCGAYPASIAAQMSPVDALRYE